MSGSLQYVGAFLIVLLTLVVLVVTVAPRLRLPPMVLLVLVGLLLNVSGLVSDLTVSPDFVFYVLLPIVIFEASFNIGVRDFLADWPRTVALALPGVVVVCVVVFARARRAGTGVASRPSGRGDTRRDRSRQRHRHVPRACTRHRG